MIQQARQMIADGLLGEIRIINMQFAHGFHNEAVELQAESTRWRVTPKYAGPSYVLGDLATHPLFVAETMAPHLNIKRLMCSRQSFVASRAPLEDNAFVLMEYDNGAVGSMWTSAVNSGAMHSQKVRIVGEKASIEWWDEHPNQLSYEVQGEPARILERGMPYLSAAAGGRPHRRRPPEGLFEAWANLYRRYAQAIDAMDRDDRAFLQTSGIRTLKPVCTASTGSSNASNPPTPAASGLTLIYNNCLNQWSLLHWFFVFPLYLIMQHSGNIC
jgi:predicted dehydrogenase